MAWLAALVLLTGMVLSEGRRRTELEARVPVAAAELYRMLARSKAPPQVVDVRANLVSGYEESRVPGALPMPGCDVGATPAAARDHILPSAPTVLVTSAGDPAEAARCAPLFTSARLLAGGMDAWTGANLPEDSGDYSPPSTRAGGGCL
jgi:rhodanese-related sulfurtransferase